MERMLKRHNARRWRLFAMLTVMLTAALAVMALLCCGIALKRMTAKACPDCQNTGGVTLTLTNGVLDVENASQYDGYALQLFYMEGTPSHFSDFQDGEHGAILSLPCKLADYYANGELKEDKQYTFCAIVNELESWDILWHSNYIYYNGKPPLSLPETPTKEGYIFVGWYLDESLTQPYNGEPITEDMTFYAKFEIIRYTVTYDSAGGSNVLAQTCDWNTTPPFAAKPTRTGYTFLGWYDGDTAYTDANGRFLVEGITANVTLTAKWKIQTFTVTFLVENEVYKTVTVEYGQSFEVATTAAAMTYFHLFDENGTRLRKATSVTENVTVFAEEMTTEEKVGTFLARNWWILCVAGGLIVVLLFSFIFAVKRR